MANMVHNGNARQKYLRINKTDSQGVPILGYPKTYSLTEAFTHINGNEPALSDEQFAKLTVTQWESRLNKFLSRVESQNIGIGVDIPNLGAGAVVYSALCDVTVPVPPSGAITDGIASDPGPTLGEFIPLND